MKSYADGAGPSRPDLKFVNGSGGAGVNAFGDNVSCGWFGGKTSSEIVKNDEIFQKRGRRHSRTYCRDDVNPSIAEKVEKKKIVQVRISSRWSDRPCCFGEPDGAYRAPLRRFFFFSPQEEEAF